jgi:alpha-amylase
MQIEHSLSWLPCAVHPNLGRNKVHDEASYVGDGTDILLQGFHWDSYRGGYDQQTRERKCWYHIIAENAGAIRSAGFTWVWFPPPSDSLAPQGYIPRRWNHLDSLYGREFDLRTALRALEPVGGLADVVLNHRVGVATSGADFEDPPFPDNHAAITRDDASGVGTGSPGTGESHPAGRNLDHTNQEVRAMVKSYLDRLMTIGFRGWRFDLVKGYDGRFVREYNESTTPGFSVGEFYDTDRQKITNWLDAVAGKSAAFDFPTRYLLYDACSNDDYSRLRSVNAGRTAPAGLIGFWSSRAVTFVDNHDTEYRRDEEHSCHCDGTRHFPGTAVDRAYAYILTHPGIPCVFWSHLFDWGEPTHQRITQLVKLRRATGIHANSIVDIREAGRGLYAAMVDGKVALRLGTHHWRPGSGWRLAVEGAQFSVWHRHGG